jgi:hypothetical protein
MSVIGIENGSEIEIFPIGQTWQDNL